MNLADEREIYMWAARSLARVADTGVLASDHEWMAREVTKREHAATVTAETVVSLLDKLGLVDHDDCIRRDRPEHVLTSIIARLARPSRRRRPGEGRKR